jgi:signal transduction histidine kinase
LPGAIKLEVGPKLIDKNDPFEKRLLETVSLFIMALVSVIVLIDISSVFVPLILFINLSHVLACAVIYFYSRLTGNYKKVQLPLIIVVYGATAALWFLATGINGPTGLAAMGAIIISFILSPERLLNRTLAFNFLYILVLGVGHIFLYQYMNHGFVQYDSVVFEYMGVGFGEIMLLYLLKREMEFERNTVKVKNDQLVHLNNSLKTTVATQFKTLKELTSTQSKLVESEKMASIGKLTAGLTHELNNPLNFVGGVIDPIKRDLVELSQMVDEAKREQAKELTDEISVLLESVENGTERAKEVIKNLMNITPKGKKDEIKAFDLTKLIADVTRLVEKSNQQIEFEYDLQDQVMVEGSEIEINQVILNLLRNSIQAIPEGRPGKIKITCKADEKAIICVEDNGCGMDRDTLENAMDAFYTTKTDGTGTGLGLFITHGIIKSHRGNLAIDSEVDRGTCISIVLPLHLSEYLHEN